MTSLHFEEFFVGTGFRIRKTEDWLRHIPSLQRQARPYNNIDDKPGGKRDGENREIPAGVHAAPHDPKLVARWLAEVRKLAQYLDLRDHLA